MSKPSGTASQIIPTGEGVGKKWLLGCLVVVTCLSTALIYNTESYLYVTEVSSDQGGFRPPEISSYLRTSARGAGVELDTPNDGVAGNSSAQTAAPENAKPCSRQVQLWRGPNEPQQPVYLECPGLECGINFVEDTAYETAKASDAIVLFHRTKWNWAEMQRRRPPNQAWAFYSLESPRHTMGYAIPPKGYDNLYNYTISYRPSSSIYGPYGSYNKTQPQVPAEDTRNWAGEKTGLIAWAASNCGTASWNRLGFVKALKQRISVDMFGGCGTIRCPRNSDECWKRISTYKFYLSVENSECRDYITEKFWWNALAHDVVPIVYGPPREDYEKVAPPHSFIHLQDFKNFDEMTSYINLLNSNDTLYNSYFEWKRHGSVRRVGEGEILTGPFLCKVVSKLLDHEKNVSRGITSFEPNPNIHDFWSSTCLRPTGFPHNFS